MTLDWNAHWLVMGVAGYAAQCLRASEAKKNVILRDPFMFTALLYR